MSRLKSKHSSLLSLVTATLFPLAASLTLGCGASGAGAGGSQLDGGSATGGAPNATGGSAGSSSKPSAIATGGTAGQSTTPTSSEGGASGSGAPPSSAGATGGGAPSEGAGGSGGTTAPPSTTTPPSTTAPPSTTTPPSTTAPPSTTGTGGSATGGSGTGGVATGGSGAGGTTTVTPPTAGGPIKYVFVVAMENEAANSIYGNSDAPYLNGLISQYAHATAFNDPLPDAVPSEPHYVWMESGTNQFSDATFTTDDDPSASNSTKSTAHLVTQMAAASPAVSWMSYPEGLDSSTGACPVHSSGFYVAKHDPFVFFQDVSGSPPSGSNAACAAHHQAYTTATFGQALAQGTVAQYNFITPNVCDDMHGDSSCPSSNDIGAGDTWLSANLPPIIDFVNAHQGVLFVVWDEPEGGSPLMPFVAIGPGVKKGYTGQVRYTHSSLTKSVDEIFGLPILPTVTGDSDLSDLFQPASFP
jgi:phosphatidylinositol-3-phosphatase